MMTKGGNMKDLLTEKRNELALEMCWTLKRAQGYVDGELSQRNGTELSESYKYGMDEYSKGFRTGYYTQACSLSITDIRAALSAQQDSADINYC
jgi:hypothetical protein